MFLSCDNWRVLHKSQLHWLSVTWMGNGSHRAPGFAPSWHPLLMSPQLQSLHEPIGCSAIAFQGVCLEQGSCPGSVNFTGHWPQKFPFQSTSIPKTERGKEITQGRQAFISSPRPEQLHKVMFSLARTAVVEIFFSVSLVYKWNGVTASIKIEHCALSWLLTGGKNPLSACELCLKCRNLNPGI